MLCGVSAAGLHGLCGASAQMAAPPAPGASQWNFRVYLDETPIGYQRFTRTPRGELHELRSEANFDVKFLFINAYRYRHEATERWRGDCLVSLNARTDDDGKQSAVTAQREGERLLVRANAGSESIEGCVMSFAYWNPAMLKQSRLLNPQTGELEKVAIALGGEEEVSARGRRLAARRYRLTGPERPIDLWYGPDGEWLALQSTVAGGRRLSYRLE